MNDVRLVLGVDGGGTKTTAWIAEIDRSGSTTHIAGQGRAGPSNATAIPFAEAADNVADAISQATSQSQVELPNIAAVCLAMAGAGHESVANSWRQWIHNQGLVNESVTSDVTAVFAAGCPKGVGIATIAGTGSIVFGKNSDDKSVRIGGWGHKIGDAGSGHWIARQALKAVTTAEDRLAPETILKQVFLAELDVGSIKELVNEVVRHDQKTWAGWSRLVFQVAETDSVAADILNRATISLAGDVCAAATQLNLKEAAPIALSGGVLTHNKAFRTKLLNRIAQQGINLEATLVKEPVSGAVVLAAHSAMAPSKDTKS